MLRKRQQPTILTPDILAEELGISTDNALELMQQEAFPSTEVYPGHYVIDRSLLEKWVYAKHRDSSLLTDWFYDSK